jgi:hypothetical protein
MLGSTCIGSTVGLRPAGRLLLAHAARSPALSPTGRCCAPTELYPAARLPVPALTGGRLSRVAPRPRLRSGRSAAQLPHGRHGGRDDDPHPLAAARHPHRPARLLPRMRQQLQPGSSGRVVLVDRVRPRTPDRCRRSAHRLRCDRPRTRRRRGDHLRVARHRREFARGVEHALLWAEFATSAPPTSVEDRGPSGSNDRPSRSGSLGDGRGAGSAPCTRADAATRARVGGPVTNHRRENEEDSCLRES